MYDATQARRENAITYPNKCLITSFLGIHRTPFPRFYSIESIGFIRENANVQKKLKIGWSEYLAENKGQVSGISNRPNMLLKLKVI